MTGSDGLTGSTSGTGGGAPAGGDVPGGIELPGGGAPGGLGLPGPLVDAVFPFHLVVDRELRILQFGDSLPLLLPGLRTGDHLASLVSVEAPRTALTFDALCGLGRRLVLLRPRGGEIVLRGQVLVDDRRGVAWFVGSPFVNDLDALTRAGLDLDDFAASDPVVDYLFLLQAQAASLADARRLNDRLREAAEEHARLAAAEQALAHDLDALPDLVLRVTPDMEVVDIRPGPDSDLPRAPRELVGAPVASVMPELAEHLRSALARAYGSDGRTQSFEYQTDRDGRVRSFEARVVQCSEQHALVLVRDVSERRELERRLRHQASHDPLCGLANRALFHERVSRALEAGDDVQVLFVDLDDFKRVNDSLGHGAGDELLRTVADRLLGCVRRSDTVARLGGDEFAILLEDCREEPTTGTGARVLQALTEPLAVHDVEVRIGASIGVAGGRDCGVDELLRRADVAMYTAKGLGKARLAVYDPGMHDRHVGQLVLEQDLRGALAGEQLSVAYQPIVDTRTGRVRGVEALLRWSHPVHGAVPPAVFVPLAERSDLIEELGSWVLERACRDARAWCSGGRDFTLSVNVSPHQLRDDSFPRHLREVLEATGMPGDQLVLEVTESAFDGEGSDVSATLRSVRALGVRIALDDFGTGGSSLTHLRRFPVDELKIDKSFVDGVARGGDEARVARAVVDLGRALGLAVVAEGVESADQRAALVELSCERAQGHLFGPPVPAAAVDALLVLPCPRPSGPAGVLDPVG